MKKLEVVFTLLLILLFPLAAQNTDGVSRQYETITWEAVEKTSKYEVIVEKLNEKGKWLKVYDKQTKQTTLEILLEPGSYRVSISTFNILGKKTTSDWTNFYILGENTPYLFDNYFEKSSEWRVPVLYINHKNVNSDSNADSRHFITAEKGFAQNSFFIKGKNIFSQNTTFYLEPSDFPLDGGKDYKVFYDARKTVPLTILQRDTKKSGVYVSYDPDLLFTGYYSIVAKNGNEKDSYGIFVSADRPLEMTLDGLEQDTRYKVNALTISDEAEILLSVIGKGFTSATRFTLIPVDGIGIDYPYASTMARSNVPINVRSKSVLNTGGTMQLYLACKTNDVKSGYYYVQADNDKDDSARCLLLIKNSKDDESEIEVTKISSKYNKRSKNVDFTVTGKNLEKYSKITIVSEYSDENEGNARTTVTGARVLPLGNKLYASVPAEEVSFGTNALMLEEQSGSEIGYFELDKHYKSHYVELNEEKADRLFLRPEGDAEQIDFNSEIQEKVTFTIDKAEVKTKTPRFSPFVRFQIALPMDYVTNQGTADNTAFQLEWDFLNFNWLYFDLGVNYAPHLVSDDLAPDLGVELMMRFGIPGRVLFPYLGVGAGYNLVDSNLGFNLVHLPVSFETTSTIKNNGFLNSTDIYFIGQVGFTLLQFFDVRYTLQLHNYLNDSDPYFSDAISLGARIPIRRVTYVRNILSQGVTITKGGEVHAADYNNLDKVTSLKLDEGVTEVNGFVNKSKLEKITLPESLQVIGPAAFKDCTNLATVVTASVKNRLNKISKEAFANDKKIQSISIPSSVTVIEEDAFAGWTEGQTIRLEWNKSDSTVRRLNGLDTTKAIVLYRNGDLYKSEDNTYESPFLNLKNWGSMPSEISINRMNYWYNDQYYDAVLMDGSCNFSPDWKVKKSGKEKLTNLVMNSKTVRFKTCGDGKKYVFLVVTSDGGYFEQSFTTKKDKVTDVKINLNGLKKRNGSTTNKLDKSKIIYAQIIPSEVRGVDIKSYFFDFEVDEK